MTTHALAETTEATKNGTTAAVSLIPRSLPIVQINALERRQQRILHRTTLIVCVLLAEQRTGAGLTLGDALAELMRDISEAAGRSALFRSRPGRRIRNISEAQPYNVPAVSVRSTLSFERSHVCAG